MIPFFRLGAGMGTASRKETNTGMMNDTSQATTWENQSAPEVPAARRKIRLAATGCITSISVGIAHNSNGADVNSAEKVHQPVVSGINDDGNLRTDAQSHVLRVFIGFDINKDRETLGGTQPASLVVDGWKGSQGVGVNLHAESCLAYFPFINLPWLHIESQFHEIICTDIAKIIFGQVCSYPHFVG